MASVAIIDVVSRKWLTTRITLTSVEESSTQVEIAVTAALEAEGLLKLVDARGTEVLRASLACGDRQRVAELADHAQVPLLLAISDIAPQMCSHSTREFLAGMAIATRFGRPGVPQDQAWIETLFGHVKGEWPHLEGTQNPAPLKPNSFTFNRSTTGSGCMPASATSP